MLRKKENLINELVIYQTSYNNGESRIYPTISGLKIIIRKMVKIKETTGYIKFNPFYKNAKLNCQIEFDDFMFYMECRDTFTMEDQEVHWTQCMDNIYDVPHEVEKYEYMDEDKKRMARILYPICKTGDYESFHNHLNNYEDYLNELIPFLFCKAIKNLNLSQDDMAFGYFCFEVESY